MTAASWRAMMPLDKGALSQRNVPNADELAFLVVSEMGGAVRGMAVRLLGSLRCWRCGLAPDRARSF